MTNTNESHLCRACSAGGLRLLRHIRHRPANVQRPACNTQVQFSFCQTSIFPAQYVKVLVADTKPSHIYRLGPDGEGMSQVATWTPVHPLMGPSDDDRLFKLPSERLVERMLILRTQSKHDACAQVFVKLHCSW